MIKVATAIKIPLREAGYVQACIWMFLNSSNWILGYMKLLIRKYRSVTWLLFKTLLLAHISCTGAFHCDMYCKMDETWGHYANWCKQKDKYCMITLLWGTWRSQTLRLGFSQGLSEGKRITRPYHHTQLISWDGVSLTFAWAGLGLRSLDICLLSAWDS
jgi:hypothetical protein